MGDLFKNGGVLFDNKASNNGSKINFVPGFLDKNKEQVNAKSTQIYRPEEEQKEIEEIIKEIRRMKRKAKKN